MTHNIRTCLWFRDGRGPEAAKFYCDLIPGSRVERSFTGDNGMGAFSVTDFTLAGTPYQILDAGPHFLLTEAVSISVETDDQAESDRLWFALTTGGGEERVCGWLKDKYGVSWQVFPDELIALLADPDPERSARATRAMLGMKKIDIAAVRRAAEQG